MRDERWTAQVSKDPWFPSTALDFDHHDKSNPEVGMESCNSVADKYNWCTRGASETSVLGNKRQRTDLSGRYRQQDIVSEKL